MRKRQSGVSLIELAITLPLLLAICFGITEFGRAIYSYNTIAKATRDGARYLSTRAASDPASWAVAKNLTVYGNPTGAGTALLPGLATSQVKIADSGNSPATNANQGTNPTINTVTVTVSGYQFSPVIDLLTFLRFYGGGNSSITSITFGDISVTMRQHS